MLGLRRRAALMAAVAVAVGGCGSTVRLTGAAAGGGELDAGAGLGAVSATGAPGSGGAPGALSPSSTSVQPEGAATHGGSPAGGTDGQGTGGTHGPVTALARGETATRLYLGIAYASGAGSTNSALGASSIDPGNARAYYDAIIDDVNKHGGVRGKTLTPVYFDTSSSGTSADQVAQAACTFFTQDNKVFAVVGPGHPVMRACSNKAGIVNLSTGFSNATSTTFTQFPNYVEISTMNLDRAGRVTVEGLAKTDYFTGSPHVGIVTWDDTAYRYGLAHGWLPALAKVGVPQPEVAYVAPPQSPNDLGAASSGVQSAILQFRQAGVDHVLISDGAAGMFEGTGLTLLWIKAASSQQYFPAYGLNQANSPQAGLDAGLWSGSDMKGARAVTWTNYDGQNAARTRCLNVMTAHGISLDNANARGSAVNACDYVEFLRHVVTVGGGASLSAVLRGVDSTGTRYPSPSLYLAYFDHTHHDGVGAVRTSAFNDSCTCFRYLTNPYRVG